MPPGFRGEEFLNFSKSETRIVRGDNSFSPIGLKWGNLIEDLP